MNWLKRLFVAKKAILSSPVRRAKQAPHRRSRRLAVELLEDRVVPSLTVQFGDVSESVNESAGTFSVAVNLSNSSAGSVSVPFTLGGTAISGTDYSGVSASPLVIPAGQTSGAITGTLLSDLSATPTLTFTLGSPTGATLGSTTVNTLTITEPASNVVRTIAYNQITELTGNSTIPQFSTNQLLSADGNRAVFAANNGETYVVNSDGTGLTLVDATADNNVDISADGSVVMDTTSPSGSTKSIHVVNADGSNLHTVFSQNGGTIFATLSPDGSTVFFTDTQAAVVNGSPGLYSISASAVNGTPTQVVTQTQIGTALGVAGTNTTMGDNNFSMGVSADGTHVIFAALINSSAGIAILSYNSNGGALSSIGNDTVAFSLNSAGISADGTKVFRYDNINGGQVIVYNFDGSDPVTLTNLPSFNNSPEHMELTSNGSQLLFGNGYLINTDNSGILQLGTDDSALGHLVTENISAPSMNSSGTEFLYTTTDLSNNFELAIAQINPTSLGVDPSVSNVTINPSYIVKSSTSTTVSAAVSSSSTLAGVTEAFELNGQADTAGFGDTQLFDDGTHGSTVASGIYVNNDVINEGPVGARTIRVNAGFVDAGGLQHDTTVEVSGLSVVSAVPSATVQFAGTVETVNESAGTFSIPVTLSASSGTAIDVPFTLGGTAVSGTDYSGVTASPLVILAGQTTAYITGTLLSDPGSNQTLTITLGTPTGSATLGSTTVNTLTINEPAATPTVQFSAASESVNESAGTFSITVNLSATSSNSVSVPFTLGGTAVSGTDYSGVSASPLVIPAGQTSGTITGTLLSDPGANQTLTFTLGTPTGANLGNTTVNTLTIDEPAVTPTVQFSAASESVNESAGTFSITVNLSATSASSVSVPFTLGGTAASGTDYSGVSASPLVISAGQTSGTITGTLLSDPGANQTLTFTLGTPTGANLGNTTVNTLTIDEPAVTPTVQFSAASESVNESAGTFSITVDLSNSSASSVSVPFTLGGTAVSGTDYSGVSASPLVIPAGQTSGTITGTLLSDPSATPTLTFTLGNPSGATLGSTTVNTLTIIEPPSNVVRTIAYNQITELTGNSTIPQFSTNQLLSADGNRAVFAANNGETYVVNSDGTGLTLVDATADNNVDISADGSVVMDTTSPSGSTKSIHVVNADGSNLHTVFSQNGGTIFATLSPDGSTVFFTDTQAAVVNGSPGLYFISASAVNGTPTQVVTQTQIGTALGVAGTNTTMGDNNFSMGVSADGTHVIFAALINSSAGIAILSYNSNGGALSSIGNDTVAFSLNSAGISADGTKVFRYDNINGGQVIVYNFDGSDPVTLTNLPSFNNSPEHMELTSNGSQLLFGNGYLINTDNSGILQLGTDDSALGHLVTENISAPSMNSSGTEFLYTTTDLSNNFELAIAQINPTSLGVDPSVSNVTINPSYIVKSSTSTTVSAAVSSSSTLAGVTEAFELNGQADTAGFGDTQLFDDGTHGSTVASGIYVNNDVINEGPVGARTIRVNAGFVDAGGLQHDTTVEVSGLSVVTSAPTTTVQFNVGSETVNESAGTFSIPVTMSTSAGSAIDVPFTLSGSARNGVDYSGLTTSPLVIPAGQTTADVTGTLLSDPGSSQTLTITLGTPTGVATLGSTTVNTLTITEPAVTPTVQFSAASESVNESAGTFSITVNLSVSSASSVSVPFTLGGTAVSGTDYSGVTASPLVISAGQTTGTITGTLLSDPGANQTLTFTLGTPTGATLGSTTVNTLTIDEPALTPSAQFSAASESVNATAGTFSITVDLSNAAGADVSVPFALSGSAIDGIAYSGVTASPLVIPAGQTSGTITGMLLSDPGPNQTLTFTMGTPTGATLGSTTVNTLTIDETALFSDSFDRANATTLNLGQADDALGGTGAYFYLPIFGGSSNPTGASIVGDVLQNNGDDYGGVQFTTSSNVSGTRGTSVGQDLDITVSLLAPTNVAGDISEAGVYFRSRAAFTGDGIFGGQAFDPSGGYWVALLSNGVVDVVDLRNNTIVAATGQPGTFDSTIFHTLQIAADGNNLQVALDGVLQQFTQAGNKTTTVAIPPTALPGDTTVGGDTSAGDAGTAGIAFGAPLNRGEIGGQEADNLTVSAYAPLDLASGALQITPSVPTVADAQVGTGTFSLAVQFDSAMNTAVTPQLTFSPNVNSTLSLASGSWNAAGTVYTATFNVANVGVSVTGIGVTVSGAEDSSDVLQANFTQNAVFAIDTVSPTVVSVTPSVSTITSAQAGSGTFRIAVQYSGTMSTAVAPTIGFVPSVTSTLTLASGSWNAAATIYTAVYNVAVSGVNDAGIQVTVTGAQNADGNTQASFNQNNVFAINTTSPFVTLVTPSVTTIANAQIGAAFTLAVQFNKAMKTTLNPVIAFSPSVASTLTFQSGAWNTAHTTYTATYKVGGSGVSVSGVGITVSGAQDSTSDVQIPYQQNNVFAIDTVSPTVTSITPSVATIADAQVGSGTFTLAIQYSATMNSAVNPTIAFNPVVSSTLTFASGSWNAAHNLYTATYNVANAHLIASGIAVTVSGAKNTDGNVQASITKPAVFNIDTVNPTVTALAVSVPTISDAQVGVAGFSVTVTFSTAMNIAVTPTVVFSPPVDSTLTLMFASWNMADTVCTLTYSVANAGVSATGIGITVSGAQDAHGNTQVSFTKPAAFNVDTVTPTVLSVTPSIATITNAAIGTTFTLAIHYSSAMKTTINPSIVFTPTVSSTLTFVSGAWNAAANTFTASYHVAGANVIVSGVGVAVSGAKNSDGNLQASLSQGGVFAINTVSPVVSSIHANVPVIADAQVGHATFTLAIQYSEAMNTSVAPVITFPAGATSTLKFVSGSWDITDTLYTATYSVADVFVSVPAITVGVSGAKSTVGNVQVTASEPNTFAIDTVNPTVKSVAPSVANITDAQAGSGTFHLAIQFSGPMNTSVAPTISFIPPIASTLSFASGSWNAAGTIYTAVYNVAASGISIAGVSVEVSGAVNIDNNLEHPFEAFNSFTINT